LSRRTEPSRAQKEKERRKTNKVERKQVEIITSFTGETVGKGERTIDENQSGQQKKERHIRSVQTDYSIIFE